MTYDRITGDIHKSTFDGHAAVNFIIERAHAKDLGGRPLYVTTFGKVTNLALALLKDPTIAPKIRAVTLMTRFPASLEPSANWTVSESNHLDDRYAAAALLENAALELHIVPWPSHVPGGSKHNKSQYSRNLRYHARPGPQS
jgi:inosine-uridine nucleoside N-ribohydrolase